MELFTDTAVTLEKFRKGRRRFGEQEEVTLRFSGTVQRAFARLYDVLAEHPEIDRETLGVVKGLSDDRPSLLDTTFAMVVHAVSAAKDCAAQSKDDRITEILDDVVSGFSALDADRPVTQIGRGTRRR